MTGAWTVWRERWRLWAIPLAFLMLNLALLSAHRLVVAVRVRALVSELEASEARLESRRTERQGLDGLAADSAQCRALVETLFADRLQTRGQRLTRILFHLKELARTAGLDPRVISYPAKELESFGLVEMSMVFGVEGTYPQLRQLISLLESTDEFLTLQQISLSGGDADGVRLSIQLRLSTMFVEGSESPYATIALTPAPPEPSPGTGDES